LVDVRLDLPQEWAKDRRCRKRCGVPTEIRSGTRPDLVLEMLWEKGDLLPHAWVTGDDEMGRSSRFRADLRALEERSLLAIPSHTTIRDRDGEEPAWSGQGGWPKRAFEPVQTWAKAPPPAARRRIEGRGGERSPLIVELLLPVKHPSGAIAGGIGARGPDGASDQGMPSACPKRSGSGG
jgi:hypothetical protein